MTDTTGPGSRWEDERDTRDGRADTETTQQPAMDHDEMALRLTEHWVRKGIVYPGRAPDYPPDEFEDDDTIVFRASTEAIEFLAAAGLLAVPAVPACTCETKSSTAGPLRTTAADCTVHGVPAAPARPPFDARMEIERTLRDAQAKGAAVEGQAATLMELVRSWQSAAPAMSGADKIREFAETWLYDGDHDRPLPAYAELLDLADAFEAAAPTDDEACIERVAGWLSKHRHGSDIPWTEDRDLAQAMAASGLLRGGEDGDK